MSREGVSVGDTGHDRVSVVLLAGFVAYLAVMALVRHPGDDGDPAMPPQLQQITTQGPVFALDCTDFLGTTDSDRC